jgi:hypothetical protein
MRISPNPKSTVSYFKAGIMVNIPAAQNQNS